MAFPSPRSRTDRNISGESGNILFMILIAIVLIGLLTVAIQSTTRPDGNNIDREEIVIRASEIQRYASELEGAVMFILRNGTSEGDIRFAHPDANSDYGDLSADTDKSDQVFAREGGGAGYQAPPRNINDGSAWEFYGGTHAPGTGSSKADLIAVLPNVTQQFCEYIDDINGQTPIPNDTGMGNPGAGNAGDCVHIGAAGRFDNGQQFYDTANTMDETTFAQDANINAAAPAPQGCVLCARDGKYHFYHVLLAR